MVRPALQHLYCPLDHHDKFGTPLHVKPARECIRKCELWEVKLLMYYTETDLKDCHSCRKLEIIFKKSGKYTDEAGN